MMNRIAFILGYLLLTVGIMGCQQEADAPLPQELLPEEAGLVIQATLLDTYTPEDIQGALEAFIPPAVVARIVPRHSVQLYRIYYSALDLNGEVVKVSGAIALPEGLSGSLPFVSYQHGGVTHDSRVPSGGLDAFEEVLIGLLLSGEGVVVSMPDYLGLGIHPGLHPFLHADSEARVSLDLMRAAREWALEQDITLDREIFLVGYSQGGHATLALQRLIESAHLDEFPLTATAPMAGPYGMATLMPDVLVARDTFPGPGLIPYVMLAYDKVYDWYEDPTDVFKPAYSTQIQTLFNDGNYSLGEIHARLPQVPAEILQPAFLEAFEQQADHPLRQALADNDLISFTPVTPVRLYHCKGDELVEVIHSEKALEYFTARGAPAELIIPDNIPGLDIDHVACAYPAVLLVRSWIGELIR